ncbi:MAG TPA: hypothetical protein VLR71_18955 [Casimicrobiaceae bacterium]|nr:hypothetical protein [Casimicrobiaceae bacterium]
MSAAMVETTATHPCAVCGASLVGPYCHRCGQPSPTAPRGLRDALTGQTGKLLYTLRRLLQPGALAQEIDRGRDRLAVRPLTLLLNLIPLFFLFGGGNAGFSVGSFIAQDPTGQLSASVAMRAERKGVVLPLFRERVEQRFKAVYSILVVVQALTYGAILGLLERRRGKAWLVHFATAIHYMCFNFIVSTLAFSIPRLWHTQLPDHPLVASLVMLVNASYMAASVHRVYGETWPIAIGKTVVLMALGFAVAMVLTIGSIVVGIATA